MQLSILVIDRNEAAESSGKKRGVCGGVGHTEGCSGGPSRATQDEHRSSRPTVAETWEDVTGVAGMARGSDWGRLGKWDSSVCRKDSTGGRCRAGGPLRWAWPGSLSHPGILAENHQDVPCRLAPLLNASRGPLETSVDVTARRRPWACVQEDEEGRKCITASGKKPKTNQEGAVRLS